MENNTPFQPKADALNESSRRPLAQETASEQPPFDYAELFSVLWGSRKLMGIITASVTVAAVVLGVN
jgi:uncharacterized protein involved in exopolysaccharide biosynthesis